MSLDATRWQELATWWGVAGRATLSRGEVAR